MAITDQQLQTISDNISKIVDVYTSLSTLNNIHSNLNTIGSVREAINTINVIAPNINAIATVSASNSLIQTINNHIQSIVTISQNPNYLDVIANTNLLNTISTNLTQLLLIHTNLTNLLTLATKINDVTNLSTRVTALDAIIAGIGSIGISPDGLKKCILVCNNDGLALEYRNTSDNSLLNSVKITSTGITSTDNTITQGNYYVTQPTFSDTSWNIIFTQINSVLKDADIVFDLNNDGLSGFESTKNVITATSGQTVFNFDFKVEKNIDIKVLSSVSGFVATGYTVTIDPVSGGTVTFSSGRTLGDVISLIRYDSAIVFNKRNRFDAARPIMNVFGLTDLYAYFRRGLLLPEDPFTSKGNITNTLRPVAGVVRAFVSVNTNGSVARGRKISSASKVSTGTYDIVLEDLPPSNYVCNLTLVDSSTTVLCIKRGNLNTGDKTIRVFINEGTAGSLVDCAFEFSLIF